MPQVRMLPRHLDDIYRRLERVEWVGVAEVRRDELLMWYDQERVTVNIWRDLEDKWHEVRGDDDAGLLVGSSEDESLYVFAYGKGLKASKDAWFQPLHDRAKRIGAGDL